MTLVAVRSVTQIMWSFHYFFRLLHRNLLNPHHNITYRPTAAQQHLDSLFPQLFNLPYSSSLCFILSGRFFFMENRIHHEEFRCCQPFWRLYLQWPYSLAQASLVFDRSGPGTVFGTGNSLGESPRKFSDPRVGNPCLPTQGSKSGWVGVGFVFRTGLDLTTPQRVSWCLYIVLLPLVS